MAGSRAAGSGPRDPGDHTGKPGPALAQQRERDLPGPVVGYAHALMTVAQAEGVLERVSDELYRFARTMESHSELRERLTDPALGVSRRQEIVGDLLGPRAHPQTTSAVMYLVQSGRARELPQIADQVAHLTAAANQRSVAEARTAVALDDDQKQRLAQAVAQATGRTIELKVIVDPSVVGGVVVSVGDTVIDGSVARRLAELRARLVGA